MSNLTLAEAAFLLRTYPINHEEAAAAWTARTCSTPVQLHRPAEEVPGLPVGADSEAAFGAAVDLAFDEMERGVG